MNMTGASTHFKPPAIREALLLATQLLLESQNTRSFHFESAFFKAPVGLHERSVALTMHLIATHLQHRDPSDSATWSNFASGTRLSGLVLDPGGMLAAFNRTNELIRQLVKDVVCEITDPLERAVALTQFYEQALEYRIIDRGNCSEVINGSPVKKRNGQFYTPLGLARKTAETALKQLLQDARYHPSLTSIKNLKILDPAMGAGIFLLCAIDYLHQWCTGHLDYAPSKLDLLNCVYGVDVDPLACEVASLALRLYCTNALGTDASGLKSMSLFTRNLRCADALLSSWSDLSGVSQSGNKHIFYWDQEFSTVFHPLNKQLDRTMGLPGGFDVVISNPPWELARPNSQEFFSVSSPNFRKLGKQKALVHTEQLLAEKEEVRHQWQAELMAFEHKSKFIRFMIQSGKTLPNQTRRPLFQAQGGSDLNVYKLFLDLGFSLLKDDGCLSMLVPSGILVDKGAAPLRKEFLSRGRIFRVESFLNKNRQFNIHSSFAYCLIGVQKGGPTEDISVSYGDANNNFTYQQKDISLLSPRWLTIFDVSHERDLEVLKKIHKLGRPLGAGSEDAKAAWTPRFTREFDMTNDSHLFIEVQAAEAENYRADLYGNWLKGKWQPALHLLNRTIEADIVPSADGRLAIRIEDIDEVLLPLYEGRMIGQFNYSKKCHENGSGRTAIWRANPDRLSECLRLSEHNTIKQASFNCPQCGGLCLPGSSEGLVSVLLHQGKPIRPHYLIRAGARNCALPEENLKVGYLAVGSATNVRTMLASALYMVPCGNSVPTLQLKGNTIETLGLTACLNSFVFDYALRMRMTGNNLNYFLLQECPLPNRQLILSLPEIALIVAALNLNHARYARQWLDLSGGTFGFTLSPQPIATTKTERLRLRGILDALIADAYGLTEEEFSWILRGCYTEEPAPKSGASSLHPKGFWRADKTMPADERLPIAAIQAYRKLQKEGKEQLLKQCALTVTQSENKQGNCRPPNDRTQTPTPQSGDLCRQKKQVSLDCDLTVLDANLAKIMQIHSHA